MRGTVTSIQKFGAFIDIGGLEGLLPISEAGWGRTGDLGDVLRVGQEVEVAVMSCDWEKNRFSFSLRATLADPWAKVGTVYTRGSTHTGTVARLTPFGAFVTLEEGVDGLLHISDPRQSQALLHMARYSFEVGETLSARAFIQRYFEVSKDTPEALLLAFRIERVLGAKDAQATYALRLRGKFPESAEAKQLRTLTGK